MARNWCDTAFKHGITITRACWTIQALIVEFPVLLVNIHRRCCKWLQSFEFVRSHVSQRAILFALLVLLTTFKELMYIYTHALYSQNPSEASIDEFAKRTDDQRMITPQNHRCRLARHAAGDDL